MLRRLSHDQSNREMLRRLSHDQFNREMLRRPSHDQCRRSHDHEMRPGPLGGCRHEMWLLGRSGIQCLIRDQFRHNLMRRNLMCDQFRHNLEDLYRD
jgi:hypothetical protein